MSPVARVVVLLALLVAPARAQFDLFDWTLQDDSGDGITGLTPDKMTLIPNFDTLGGGALLVYKSVAPVDGRITVQMTYYDFDGECGVSVPVFILDGKEEVLAQCFTIGPQVFRVQAGSEFALGMKTFVGSMAGEVFFTDFQFDPIPPFEAWTNLGNGLGRTTIFGIPALMGTSLLYPHYAFSLSLSAALPFTPFVLVVGFSELDAPFKGGVLVPSPALLVVGLTTDEIGGHKLSTWWPNGVPSGLHVYFQVWQPDPFGPAGMEATNALRANVP